MQRWGTLQRCIVAEATRGLYPGHPPILAPRPAPDAGRGLWSVMRITVEVPADEPFMPDNLSEHIGRLLPIRIGDLGYPTTILAVKPLADGGYVVDLDLPDSDLGFEAWAQRVVVANGVVVS